MKTDITSFIIALSGVRSYIMGTEASSNLSDATKVEVSSMLQNLTNTQKIMAQLAEENSKLAEENSKLVAELQKPISDTKKGKDNG